MIIFNQSHNPAFRINTPSDAANTSSKSPQYGTSRRCDQRLARPGSISPVKNVHFSSKSDEWPTPQEFFDLYAKEFGFTLDVCATPENAKCALYFTRTEDGLAQEWGTHTCWMNPPYGRSIGHWMQKACDAAQKGALVVCLVPARTDTNWWHEYAMRGEIRFLRGRLKFGGCRNPAPFPSAVVIFRPTVATGHVMSRSFRSLEVHGHIR